MSHVLLNAVIFKYLFIRHPCNPSSTLAVAGIRHVTFCLPALVLVINVATQTLPQFLSPSSTHHLEPSEGRTKKLILIM